MRRTTAVPLAYAGLLVVSIALAACDAIEDKLLQRPPGERLYLNLCASCHGADGQGNTVISMGNPNNNIVDASSKYGTQPSTMENLVREGIFAEMPAHPELTHQQVSQIIDHVLKLRGQSRGPG